MKPDPIMREVYRMKDQLEHDIKNDPHKLFALLQEDAKTHPERMASPNVGKGKATVQRRRVTSHSSRNIAS